ncbi:LOW QUALITY PROTEIN: hypothetical protein PHMEG_00017007 [Phytophthora megakarya]|uniref:Integrase catalytic domain-containing protein n=1 Tax=Phytophthora megakarya TaxID=4795 RepID=A0A225VXC5_9STRA|nr:LOW QUALITY PROTEIN: hypothetical protein PHMEG_00017007 [Phytophthora megakarya]
MVSSTRIEGRAVKPIQVAVAARNGERGIFVPGQYMGAVLLAATLTTAKDAYALVPAVNSSTRSVKLPTKKELGTWIPITEDMTMLEVNGNLRRGHVHEWIETLGDTETPLEDESDVNIGVDDEEARGMMIKLLRVYRKLTKRCGECPPPTSVNVTHHIDTGGAKPILLRRRRRQAHSEEKVIDNNVTKMLAAGVIEEGDGAWGFPVVLGKKRDGEIHFCVDYRALDSVTKRDVYPLPRIDETLEILGAGYWQILVAPEDKYKTAFTTKKGLYRFVRMPFGLTNAHSIFQRLMNNVLRGLTWVSCLVYLDDIVIFTRGGIERHIVEVAGVLERLEAAGLTLKLKKCAFATPLMEYLGHQLSSEDVRPVARLTDTIPTADEPVETKRFVHLAGYYRRFVDGFGAMMSPLTKLLRKGVDWEWTEAQESTFEHIKQILTTKALLTYPDFRRTFRLVTDASTAGLGACLMQKFDDGWKPISYASKVTSTTEAKYGITELEFLAVVWSIKLFRPYLYGRRFTITTDHAALKCLMKSPNLTGKLHRWALLLQDAPVKVLSATGRRRRRKQRRTATTEIMVMTNAINDESRSGVMTSAVQEAPTMPLTRSARRRAEQAHRGQGTTTAVPQPENLPYTNGQVVSTAGELGTTVTYALPRVAVQNEQRLKKAKVPKAPATRGSLLTALQQSRRQPHKKTATRPTERQRQEAMTRNKVSYPIRGPDDVHVRWREPLCDERELSRDESVREQRADGESRLPRGDLMTPTLQLDDATIMTAQRRSKLMQKLLKDKTYNNMNICSSPRFNCCCDATRVSSCIAPELWAIVFKECHDSGEVRRWVTSCQECGSWKAKPRKVIPPLRSIRRGDGGDRWALDVAGPLPADNQGRRYVVAALEYITRYAVADAVTDHTGHSVAEFLMKRVVLRFGHFRELLTDGAPELTGRAIERLVDLLQARQTTPVPYRLQMIGLVERYHRTWKDCVSTFMQTEEQNDWSMWVDFATYVYNSGRHSTSVQEAGELTTYHKMLVSTLKQNHVIAERARQNEQARQAKYYNRRVRTKSEFKIGGTVWMYRPPRGAQATKFVHSWIDPLKIVDAAGYENFLVERVDVSEDCGESERYIAHVSFWIHYNQPYDLLRRSAHDLNQQLAFENAAGTTSDGEVTAATIRPTTAPVHVTAGTGSKRRKKRATTGSSTGWKQNEQLVEL